MRLFKVLVGLAALLLIADSLLTPPDREERLQIDKWREAHERPTPRPYDSAADAAVAMHP